MSRAVSIGIGCRKGCAPDVIESLIESALDRIAPVGQVALFTIADKRGEAGLVEAARRLGLVMEFLSHDVLQEQEPRIRSRSARVKTLFGVSSVAEAAALAGAGPYAILLVERLASGGATCAIAAVPDGPS